MPEKTDPGVQKILSSQCWAKGCESMSEFKTGFLRSWESPEKPCLCRVHQDYHFHKTHYGDYNTSEKKWSCCSKQDVESFCEELQAALDKFKDSIPETAAQQDNYKINQRALEARVESDFSSSNWDRS